MRLSESERQVLVAVGRACRRHAASDRQSLAATAQLEMEASLDWDDAFVSLTEKGVLFRSGENYFPTKQEFRPWWKYMYDEYFSRAQTSQAHAKFCERAYGSNLCQHGVADMGQINALIDVLELDETNRVLELGCGNGRITEYISDITGAHITGLDISDVAIQQAQARTEEKRDRLLFCVGHIHDLDFQTDSFDTAILIDVIYFVNRDKTLAQLKEILEPKGQMGIFCTQFLAPEDSEERLQPDKTGLAQSLQEHQLHFAAHCFSKEEAAHCRQKVAILKALETEFAAEGNVWLYNFRLEEVEDHAKSLVERKRSRYLYHVRLP
jgi:ubiquinone/menaquinone biosynthesis C-methylase UbiE